EGGEQSGRAKLLGYDQVSFQPIGYFGTSGFRETPLPSNEEFAIDGRRAGYKYGVAANFTDYVGHVPIYRRQYLQPAGHVYVLSDKSVFDVNLREKTVERLQVGDNIVSIDVGSIVTESVKTDDAPTKYRSARSKFDNADLRRRLFLRSDTEVIAYKPQDG